MIYRAAINDFDIVNKLFEDVMDYEDKHIKYSVFQKNVYPTKEVLKESIRDGFVFILKNDEKVALVGFGSFSVSERSARSGRNPQTGKTIQIPAKKVVRFKAGAELAESL